IVEMCDHSVFHGKNHLYIIGGLFIHFVSLVSQRENIFSVLHGNYIFLAPYLIFFLIEHFYFIGSQIQSINIPGHLFSIPYYLLLFYWRNPFSLRLIKQ